MESCGVATNGGEVIGGSSPAAVRAEREEAARGLFVSR